MRAGFVSAAGRPVPDWMHGAARLPRQRRQAVLAAASLACWVGQACGQAPAQPPDSAPSLPEVTVTTPAGAVPSFELAGSADRVEGEALREDRLQVNLSEGLAGVPSLQLLNRSNYAQDLQLSIRGFGARSTFGVRGVRLYVDGIPATLPDGQGQTSNIDLGSADRVEVLRGPFSALYGNSSGGVVQVFTEEGRGPPALDVSTAVASHGTGRAGFKLGGSNGRLSYLVSASRFHTDGWRAHSRADRELFNARLGLDLGGGDKLSLVANHVTVRAQDSLGLNAQQLRTDPRRASAALADQYDTHKDVEQTQFGLTYEGRLGHASALRLMAYVGRRDMLQLLAIPVAPQRNPTHSGGVVGFVRDYAGADARLSTRGDLAGRPWDLVAGLAWDDLRERRRGYENFIESGGQTELGVVGALRRDERNRVNNLDPYLQVGWRPAEPWRLELGLRRSSVRFSSRDHYIVGANGDDSYAARYRKLLPTAALRWQPSRDLAVYAAFGRGFETPTLNELAYQAGGAGGINAELRPARSNNLELGLKARLGGGLLTAAVFQTGTRDEIVTLANVGGRSTYQNASRTRRRGLELSWQHETARHWRTQIAYTLLDATYRASFCAPAPCTPASQVAAGNRIPGIARQVLYANVGWMPPEGWHAGAELRVLSGIHADDRNSARAPGYGLVSLHAGYRRQLARWRLAVFVRVDNALNRRTVGSVIVNEGNARYFEPAPGRNWVLGLSAVHAF
ncbi:MAG TPA: TonB-dependent receptor [Ottowia sp.]|uniref:TonB-dependent receptor n=1 Tax=Ottowia sp. TaxID=1898956 RepID=UPI002CAEB2E7|nr:TonB-dependent receptor [Ottowia sp.]HMN20533.1 TonB-dependent receptor [Ottowia sp.]